MFEKFVVALTFIAILFGMALYAVRYTTHDSDTRPELSWKG